MAACSCAPISRRLSSRTATASGLSRVTWAAGSRASSVAACSCAPASRRRPAGGPRVRVVECGVGGGIAGQQRGGLLVRLRLPQAAQQAGHAARVVECGVGGGIAGQQRGGLLVRARLPQAAQQVGHEARVVEGDVGGGPVRGAGIRGQARRETAEVEGGAGVTSCGGVLVQLGGVPVQAAGVGGAPERGLVAGRGVRGGGPELRRGDLAGAVRPAVLVQVVREPVQRPRGASQIGRLVPAGAGRPGRAGAGADAGQRPADALGRDGGVGQGLFQPVLAKGVPLGVGQVPRRGGFQEGLRQARSHAQAAGIHRGVDQRPGGGRGVAVPGQQLRRPGQELDHLPVACRPGRQHQPRVCRPGELAHLRRGERGGHGDVVPGQQVPRLRVPVLTVGRAGGQGVPELGPHGGQHQYRGPAGVAQQRPQPGRDLLARLIGGVEVELGLVQPHHRPRPDARQLAQRRIRAGRVDRMPQPPRRVLVPEHLQGLPAGPGLARGGPAHQHRDPAATVRRHVHHLAQHLIMLARHIGRQQRQPRRRILRLHRPVHLQRERVLRLGQRPPGRPRGQRPVRLAALHGRRDRTGPALGLRPVRLPPACCFQQPGRAAGGTGDASSGGCVPDHPHHDQDLVRGLGEATAPQPLPDRGRRHVGGLGQGPIGGTTIQRVGLERAQCRDQGEEVPSLPCRPVLAHAPAP